MGSFLSELFKEIEREFQAADEKSKAQRKNSPRKKKAPWSKTQYGKNKKDENPVPTSANRQQRLKERLQKKQELREKLRAERDRRERRERSMEKDWEGDYQDRYESEIEISEPVVIDQLGVISKDEISDVRSEIYRELHEEPSKALKKAVIYHEIFSDPLSRKK